MMKQIFVQAQADHIASLAKAAPLSALEELIWNALDADAREVRVDLVTNPLGAVEAVRVSDDGTGIDALQAESTFGSLGGSWKRAQSQTGFSHRRLHGRQGRGRFKAFALGARAEWRTTVATADGFKSYVLAGELERPGVFEVTELATPGPGTGTEVYVSAAHATCDSLLNAAETVQSLAAKFALYLKSYPGVCIYFNGLPVTPVVVQRQTTSYRLAIANGGEARLEVIEWKRKFSGAGRMILSGPDGMELHDRPALVRSGGVPFTAYLVAARFPALSAENALVREELNPEVRLYLDEARRVLKAHFKALGETTRNPEFVREWKERLSALSAEEMQTVLLLVKKALKKKIAAQPAS